MKRFFAFVLAGVLCLGMLSGCNDKENPAVDESRDLYVLFVGNRQSMDAAQLLPAVFQAEQPNCHLVVGVLQGEDYQINQHKQMIAENSIDYVYFKNIEGQWDMTMEVTMADALGNEPWDVVILQEMNTLSGKASAFANDDIAYIVDYIKANTDTDPALLWNFVWSNPVIPEGDEPEKAWLFEVGAPGNIRNWCDYYTKNFQNDDKVMFNAMAENVQKYIVDKDQGFSGVISTAAAIQYLKDVAKLDDSVLYRDYAHLSDAGRLAAAYVVYGYLSGMEEVANVSVDRIPAELQYAILAADSDVEVSETYRAQIKEAANYALKNPLTAPA